jgi:Na+/melibiose symporter-like transporter
MVAPLWMLRDFDRPRGAERLAVQNTIAQQLRIALGCHRFVWLAVSYLAMLTGAGALTAAAPYLIAQVLGRADIDLGVALGAMLLVTTLTIPLWSALGRRFGDRVILACAAVAYGLLSVGLALSVWARPSWTATLSIFAALGAPFAAAQVLPFTLLAHLIHEEVAKRTGAEGIFTGMWTAAEKVGLALGPGLLGLALAIWGHARVTIPPFIGIVPVALMLGALIPLFISRSPPYANSLRGRRAHQ